MHKFVWALGLIGNSGVGGFSAKSLSLAMGISIHKARAICKELREDEYIVKIQGHNYRATVKGSNIVFADNASFHGVNLFWEEKVKDASL